MGKHANCATQMKPTPKVEIQRKLQSGTAQLGGGGVIERDVMQLLHAAPPVLSLVMPLCKFMGVTMIFIHQWQTES